MKKNSFDFSSTEFTLDAKGTMVDPMDNIWQQARQGSVAAVIQVLNERLSNRGIRTRAVLDRGILQLLCEAEEERQLEQTPVVEKVTEILEAIAPRHIRRVNINSRLVREQQLLWLEEIQRDPEGQLLWSELVKLRQPPIWKRWSYYRQGSPAQTRKTSLPDRTPSQSSREQRQFRRGIVGGLVGGGAVVVLGFVALSLLRSPDPVVSDPVEPADTSEPATANDSGESTASSDPFPDAVRLAQAAAQEGQTAATEAEWLALAEKWQQASDLMAEVPAFDDRYQIAQDRTVRYRENSEAARSQAEKFQ